MQILFCMIFYCFSPCRITIMKTFTNTESVIIVDRKITPTTDRFTIFMLERNLRISSWNDHHHIAIITTFACTHGLRIIAIAVCIIFTNIACKHRKLLFFDKGLFLLLRFRGFGNRIRFKRNFRNKDNFLGFRENATLGNKNNVRIGRHGSKGSKERFEKIVRRFKTSGTQEKKTMGHRGPRSGRRTRAYDSEVLFARAP